MASTIEEKINEAAATIEEGLEESKVEETVEPSVEETEEETSEEEETEPSDELDAESIDEAKRLYKALKDPTAARTVVAALAAQMGLMQGEAPETKKEVKEQKKTILDKFKEHLGSTYPMLAEPIAKAVEAVLEEERAERQTSVAQLEQVNLQREIDDVLASLARETNNESRKLEAKMVAKMKDLQPGPNQSVDAYLRDIFKVVGGKTTIKPSREITERIRRNANDVSSRISSTATPRQDDNAPRGKLSLNDSIKWAVSQIDKGKK